MELTINNKKYSISSRRKIQYNNDEPLFYCTKCKQYLPISSFELKWNNSKTEKNNIRSECKQCRCEESRLYHFYRRRKYTDLVAKEKMIHLDKLKHDLNYHNQILLWKSAKQHAKKLNIEFTIQPTDIIIPIKCPILKKNFILHDKKYTYSIDRIDNNKGYIKGNVAVISRLANMMKNCASKEELLLFSKNIKSYIKK